jgi:carbamoyltransferase
MLEDAADQYLEHAEPAPFMIKTFKTLPENRDDIGAVLHPSDGTTRPQTVRKDQNPRYYSLIKSFEEETGIPVLLNTSFNDHAEPIVNNPTEAIKDFFGMGLDLLVMDDIVVRK